MRIGGDTSTALSHSSFVEVEIITAGLALAQQQIRLVDAVEVTILRHFKAAQIGKCRHKIDAGKYRIIHAPRWHPARPTHDARQPVARLVGRAFAIAQRAGFAPENGVGRMPFTLCVFVLIRTVVARVNDQRVVGQFQFIQRVE